MNGLAGTPPTLRMKKLRNGSSKAQFSTSARVQRGSGCCFMIETPIIVASNGNSDPEWLETIRPRPCEGTLKTPLACTRHQRS